MKNVTRKKERRPKTVVNGRHSVPRRGRRRVGLQGRDSNPQPLGYEPSELPVALPCYKNLCVSCAALKRWASATVISWSSHTTNHHERNAHRTRNAGLICRHCSLFAIHSECPQRQRRSNKRRVDNSSARTPSRPPVNAAACGFSIETTVDDRR